MVLELHLIKTINILCKMLLANDLQRFVTNNFLIFNNCKITDFKGLYDEKKTKTV